MANYKETTAAGSSYQRAWRVEIENPLNQGRSVTFHEENVIVLDNGETVHRTIGNVRENLTQDNINEVFDILDPDTGLPTGQTGTYGEEYIRLFSLYMHLATKRDNTP